MGFLQGVGFLQGTREIWALRFRGGWRRLARARVRMDPRDIPPGIGVPRVLPAVVGLRGVDHAEQHWILNVTTGSFHGMGFSIQLGTY